MDIKDNLVGLYIKQFIIPRALIFDKPGFVSFRISGKTNVYARQVLMPEDFFVKLEKRIVDVYGDEGKIGLYSAGKKFGYSFAQLGRFENINDHPGESIRDWIVIAGKFIEGTYASELRPDIDIAKKIVDSRLRNFVICRKLGYDFFFATGGAAGVIAWIFQDKDIEGYYYDSRLTGEEHTCRVLCAPYEIIERRSGKNIFRENGLSDLNQDLAFYNKFNEVTEFENGKSFSEYIDAKIFSYERGIIKLRPNNERFFLMETSGMYILETELKKRGMSAEIFDVAYTVGEELFGGFSYDVKASSDLMMAFGWGEIILLPNAKNTMRVIINHFPCTKWYKDIDFLIIRGLLSGIFSRIYNRVIKFDKPEIDMHNSYLSLVFNES